MSVIVHNYILYASLSNLSWMNWYIIMQSVFMHMSMVLIY